MITNKLIGIVFTLLAITACSQSSKKDRIVGGRCEGCEAALEYGDRKLNAVDTLPDFNTPGPKLLVTGTIFHRDGKTPAENVILYVYHTNQQGIYPTKGDETNWAQRHGFIRGWVKTGKDGRYSFYTLRPAAYPGREAPEHIHAVIKENGMSPYYIDDYLFDDDPILSKSHRDGQENRGGNGIMKVEKKANGIGQITRNITLGLNVEGY